MQLSRTIMPGSVYVRMRYSSSGTGLMFVLLRRFPDFRTSSYGAPANPDILFPQRCKRDGFVPGSRLVRVSWGPSNGLTGGGDGCPAALGEGDDEAVTADGDQPQLDDRDILHSTHPFMVTRTEFRALFSYQHNTMPAPKNPAPFPPNILKIPRACSCTLTNPAGPCPRAAGRCPYPRAFTKYSEHFFLKRLDNPPQMDI